MKKFNTDLFNPLLYTRKYHEKDISELKFLVTGGAGFIGSNLAEYLIKYQAGKIRVLDNLSNGYIENIQAFIDADKIEFINGDIRDIETCRTAVKGIDYVFHQAALGSVPRSISDPITTNDVNISGFLNMLISSNESESVRRFIYAASSSTYGDSEELPTNELYASVFSKVYGIETIGLRYFNVFGPKQSPDNPYASVIPLFIKSALNKKAPIIYGDGQTSRDFTFIENVIQANMKSLFSNVNNDLVSNVACGKQISLTELWELIAINFDCQGIKPIYSKERKGDIKHSLASLELAKNRLGYNPYYSVEQGINIMRQIFLKSI